MFRRILFSGVLLGSLVVSGAEPPGWWAYRGATGGNLPVDNAAINQGQLKHFTQKAVQELNSRIPGGAGPELNGLLSVWEQAYQSGGYNAANPLSADFDAMNAGQLKWIASKIHARLVFSKYESEPPEWLVQNAATDNQLVNVGQLKTVFHFDLTAPTGQLPPWWQKFYFNGQTGIDPSGDDDGDGLTTKDEYLYHTDPTDESNSLSSASQDSDRNGLPDWWEMINLGKLGNDPNETIPQNKDLTLWEIYYYELHYGEADSMNDGIPDTWKILHDLSTTDPEIADTDTDFDNISNIDEYEAGTDPNSWDSDGDWNADGEDVYPLIPDPPAPWNFEVFSPSFEREAWSPLPDWSAVDHTSVTLEWESDSTTAGRIIVERRCDSDVWKQIANLPTGTTSHSDSGLLAGCGYEYRIKTVVSQDGTDISSPRYSYASYSVPLDLQIHVKSPSLEYRKDGYKEFATPSSPPKYYLKRTDTSSYSKKEKWEVVGQSEDSSIIGSTSYVSEFIPSEKKWHSKGSYLETSDSTEILYSVKTVSSSTSKFDHEWTEQMRVPNPPGIPDPATSFFSLDKGKETKRFDGTGVTTNAAGVILSNTSSASSSEASYELKSTFVPTGETYRWLGTDFDLSQGTIQRSGSSSHSGTPNYALGSTPSTDTFAQAVPHLTGGTWSGTRTDMWGQTTSMNYAPYSSPLWDRTSRRDYYGWFVNLQSTTKTQRTYDSSITQGGVTWLKHGTHLLSDEYMNAAFKENAVANMPDYQDRWEEDYFDWRYGINGSINPYDSGASYTWFGSPGSGSDTAHFRLNGNEDQLSIRKFKYKLGANPSMPATMRWYEIFVPDDDTATPGVDESKGIKILNERSWTLGTSANNSPEFEIDPTTLPPLRNGYYTLLFRPASINVDGVGEGGKDKTGDDEKPGKVALVNNGDADNDGVPDFADGYDRLSSFPQDDESPGASFVPIHIGLMTCDYDEARVKFTFSDSDPGGVTRTSTELFAAPAVGMIRLWTKDGGVRRDSRSTKQGGDIIKPGVEYTLGDLGIPTDGWADLWLYAEIVKPSNSTADIPIKVEIKPNADLGFRFSDQVRFTGVTGKLYQRSPREEEFTPVGGFNISKVGKAESEPYLEVDKQLLPGRYQENQLVIEDPRSTMTKAYIHGQEIPLSRSGGRLKSSPFICVRHGTVKNIAGIPELAINIADGPTDVAFNPILPYNSKNHVKNMTVDRRGLAREIDKVIEELKVANFDPISFGYNPTDMGAFGKEVHKRVGENYRNSSQWIVGGYFREMGNGDFKYLGTLEPVGGIAGTTEVDIMRLKGKYRPSLGTIIKKSNIDFLADIKTTTSGALDFTGPNSQGNRLIRLLGGDAEKLNVVVPFDRWTPSGGWLKNKRFTALAKVLGPLALAGSIWNAMNAEAFEADFQTLKHSAVAIQQAKNSEDLVMTQALLLFQVNLHVYLAHFVPDDEINTVATISNIYRIIATDDFDWTQVE